MLGYQQARHPVGAAIASIETGHTNFGAQQVVLIKFAGMKSVDSEGERGIVNIVKNLIA